MNVVFYPQKILLLIAVFLDFKLSFWAYCGWHAQLDNTYSNSLQKNVSLLKRLNNANIDDGVKFILMYSFFHFVSAKVNFVKFITAFNSLFTFDIF